jgi:aspartyl/asparaginyl-tRNA synthetase
MSKKKNQDFPIKLIKMRYGETIIARLKKIDQFYILKDPMVVVYIPFVEKDGSVNSTEIAFRDWIEGSLSKEYQIPVDSVLVVTDCEATIQITYEKILLENDNGPFFDNEYLKEITDFYENRDDDEPKKNKKKDTGNGPDREKLGDDEDDLDTNGWDDFPPKYKQ